MGSSNAVALVREDQTGSALGGLQIPVYSNTAAMFVISVKTTLGNRRNTLFWTDRWLNGCCLKNLAPNVFKCVPWRVRKLRTVSEALQEHTDIRGALHWHGPVEYLELW